MPPAYKKLYPESRAPKRRAVKKTTPKKYVPSGKDLPSVSGSSSEYISSITALKRRNASDEALYLLQKIASMVKPVMRAHGLRVGTLCEFFPKDSRLLGLNVNHGMKICIRLRRPNNDESFYPLTELLGTMLHELSHNKHGPHDDKFYKYMGELRTQLEDLMAQGFTGDSVFGQGNKLGKSLFGTNGRTLSGLPVGLNGLVDPVKLAEAKKRALQLEAEDKVKPSRRGRKLGTLTGKPVPALSLRELTLRAAEQRIEDAKWCGKNQDASLEELGMDGDVIEIKASDFKAVPRPTSLRVNTPLPKSHKDQNSSLEEVIDLTNDDD